MATSRRCDSALHLFERLKNFRVTSSCTRVYNCIAWAAGCDDRWWWPHRRAYWPLVARGKADVQSFENAFRTLGYDPCADGDLEDGVEKVAIYVKDDEVAHMARQVSSGWWTSKLGRGVDIEHESPAELEGEEYGTVTHYMRRKRLT